MRNLKRVLSLVLAAMMLIGMMVVGAGAVDAKDFTDYDEIQNTEAVSVMNLLNIIAGKEDGSYFDPSAPVTRGEMAKMITVALNGGKDPVLGTKDTPTFSDIDNHWAEAYIEYCANQGIIAGRGDGTFDPNGNVTGTEAAKMMLVAMNYNATVFGLEGNNWAITTNALANDPKADLYDGIEYIDPSEDISRDDVAQLIYNGIQAGTMVRTWELAPGTGQTTETYTFYANVTLLSERYDVDIYEGVLASTGLYDLSNNTALGSEAGTEGDSDSFVVNVEKLNNNPLDRDLDQRIKAEGQDLTAYMGQYVKALYNDTKDLFYGVYPVEGMNTVVETTTSLVSYPIDQPTKVKIDGTLYNIETGTDPMKVFVGTGAGTTDDTCNDATANRISANKVVFVDNDGNGKFDVALVTPINVAKITYLSNTTVTMSLQGEDVDLNYDPQSLSPRLENIIYDEDMAKGDFVVVSLDFYSGDDKLELIDVTSGTVEGVRYNAANTAITDYQVDGTWHKVANGYTMPTVIKSGSGIDYVAIDGVLFYAKQTSGAQGVEDLAIIYGMGYGATDTFDEDTLTAKIILADGTKKTVTVAKLLPDVDGTPVTLDKANLNDEDDYMGILLTYEVNNDGEYEFTKLTTNNMAGFDTVNYAANPGAATKDNEISNTVVSDDAAIILVTTIAKDGSVKTNEAAAVKLITGKEYKSVNNSGNAKFTANAASIVVGKDADGFSRVQAAVVIATTNNTTGSQAAAYNTADKAWTLGTFSGSNYGYLTANSWTTTIDGKKYNGYSVWNGSETVTLFEEDSTDAKLPARTVITYDVVDDTTIKNVDVKSVRGAATAYSASNGIISLVAEGNVGVGTEYKITDDTVILNVNDADKVGVEGNAITTAREVGINSNVYMPNVYYVLSANASGSEVLALVFDVTKNELNGATVPSGLALTAAEDTTDGLGVNTTSNKIGVPVSVSDDLDVDDTAAIQTYVANLFGNELSVVINDNEATCTTAVVTGPSGVADVYDLVKGYAAQTLALSAAGGHTSQAACQTAAEALLDTNHAAGVAVAIKSDADGDGTLAENDVVTVVWTAANGDKISVDVTIGA